MQEASSPLSSTDLEIHYINVGWGGAVFVKGPGANGAKILIEAGNTGMGTTRVVPYLQSIGFPPGSSFDYTIAGHQHCDHVGGMDEVINAGYGVTGANYYNGSSYSSSCTTEWSAAASSTGAGALVPAPVGGQLALGNGATLTFVARNGSIIGGGSVSVSDENDRSIALLIQYGGFDYLWASDMGGGSIDSTCTGRSTSQADVESSVIAAISPGGASPRISRGGIDVLHVNHHGSESSTNMNWMNGAAPTVAVIGVGNGETSGWDLPRKDVVEHVLLAQSTACITAPPALVVQTEEGAPAGSNLSTAGYSVGDIKISTDGASGFTVSADGAVSEGPNEGVAAGLPRTFSLDDAVLGTIAVTSPNGGESWTAGSTHNITWTSSGVATVTLAYTLDGGATWTSIATGVAASAGTYSWALPGTASTSAKVRVSDASNAVVFDDSNAVFTIAPPATLTVTSPNGGESWGAGSTQGITWTSSQVSAVKLEYSTDNGSTWTTIASSVAASPGSYAWTVPSPATSLARVRATDAVNGTPSDTSNAAFSITTPARVIINEILANEPGSNTAAEFVELVNVGGTAAGIGGWTISDASSVRHTFSVGTTLNAGKAIVVFGASSAIPPGLTNAVGASTGGLSLNNTGDTVTLKNGSTVVDQFAYPSSLSSTDGVSMNRSPDATAGASFVLHTALSTADSSPGTRANGTSF